MINLYKMLKCLGICAVFFVQPNGCVPNPKNRYAEKNGANTQTFKHFIKVYHLTLGFYF